MAVPKIFGYVRKMSYLCIAKKETLWIVPQQFKLTTFDTVQLTYPYPQYG